LPDGISELYSQVIEVGKIEDAMAISNFLNPIEEDKEENPDQATPDDILQEIIEEHVGVQEPVEEADEQVQPQHTSKDALRAIQVLIECAETTENLPSKYIRCLEKLETVYKV
jgi:hypothetical protein